MDLPQGSVFTSSPVNQPLSAFKPSFNKPNLPPVIPAQQPLQTPPSPVHQQPQPSAQPPMQPVQQPQAQPFNPNEEFQAGQEEEIFSWSSPSRPFVKRDKEYFTTIAVIAMLFSIILFFFGQTFLIAVIFSFMFVAYVLGTVAPELVKHSITNYGVRSGEKLYFWNELGRFWFTNRYGNTILNIEYAHRYLNKISLLLGDIPEAELKALLLQFLPFQSPPPTFVEKAGNWLQEKIPMDKK